MQSDSRARAKRIKKDPNWLPSNSLEESDEEKMSSAFTKSKGRGRRSNPTLKGGNKSPVAKTPKRQQGQETVSASESSAIDGDGMTQPPLRIAAFNIRIFGAKKMKNKNTVDNLVKILQRYDLILIQEIRDSSSTALDELVARVSKVDTNKPFAAVVSERLGRSHSKEQYAFMYRIGRLSVKDVYQYDDGKDNGNDVFQREPYAVRFTSPSTEVQDFAIIAIHTDPGSAVKEIGALHKVYEVTKNHWGLEDIIIAGDLNADEGYVNRDDWKNIALRSDRRFKWLIHDDHDTTVGYTDRAYDRFVVAGHRLLASIVPKSVNVFKFDEELGLSQEEAETISDHYPIELELMGRVNQKLQSQYSTSVSVTVNQKKEVNDVKSVQKIYQTKTGNSSAFFKSSVKYDGLHMVEVVAIRKDISDVLKTLNEFQKAFPGVVFDGTLQMVKLFLDSKLLSEDRLFVYGLVGYKNLGKFDVTVTAKLQNPLLCSVTITEKLS